jgi:hypothetical protein
MHLRYVASIYAKGVKATLGIKNQSKGIVGAMPGGIKLLKLSLQKESSTYVALRGKRGRAVVTARKVH